MQYKLKILITFQNCVLSFTNKIFQILLIQIIIHSISKLCRIIKQYGLLHRHNNVWLI